MGFSVKKDETGFSLMGLGVVAVDIDMMAAAVAAKEDGGRDGYVWCGGVEWGRGGVKELMCLD